MLRLISYHYFLSFWKLPGWPRVFWGCSWREVELGCLGMDSMGCALGAEPGCGGSVGAHWVCDSATRNVPCPLCQPTPLSRSLYHNVWHQKYMAEAEAQAYNEIPPAREICRPSEAQGDLEVTYSRTTWALAGVGVRWGPWAEYHFPRPASQGLCSSDWGWGSICVFTPVVPQVLKMEVLIWNSTAAFHHEN
jgi:hypothetical protein